MAANARRLLSLYALYARMDFRWFTQDTAYCMIVIFSDLLSSIASLSGIFLLSTRFAGVGGLSADEVLFLLGFYTLSNGLTFMLLGSNNVMNISRRVGRGQVDHMLIQPVPIWMQLLAEGFMPVSGNSGLLCGLVLFTVAVARLHIAVTPLWLLLLLVYLLVQMAVLAGASYWIGASAFYKPVACEEVSSLTLSIFWSLGKYPLSGLPDWLTGLFVTVLPVGLMGWVPSLVLLGRETAASALIIPITVGATLLGLATHTFRKGLKHYVLNGCNRYRDLGHRG